MKKFFCTFIADTSAKQPGKIMKRFALFLFVSVFAFTCNAFAACTSNQIDVNGDASNCIDTKFTITTTELSANTEFKFYMSASGTFYVDCGNDGRLSGNGVTNKTITRNDLTEDLYTCTYSTGGVKTIKMSGLATGYSTVQSGSDYLVTSVVPTIRFGYTGDTTPSLISAISGSIGQIFPTLGIWNGQQPRFFATFYECNNLTQIPSDLFSGVSGVASYMFQYTFARCYNLQSIPENLFINIDSCSSYAGNYKLFADTFLFCTSLTSIPEKLFENIYCSGGDLFIRTFEYCTGLTSIPENLFKNITYGAGYMFHSIFAGCTGLTQLPDGLFRNITSVYIYAFAAAFNGCTNLSGYVPPSMFAGLITAGSPDSTGMMTNIFYRTNLDTSCPAGITQYRTDYEQYWNTGNGNAVSCGPSTIYVNWYNGNSQLTVGSESQTCVYGDSITVPTINATKPGYHFNGWKIKQ